MLPRYHSGTLHIRHAADVTHAALAQTGVLCVSYWLDTGPAYHRESWRAEIVRVKQGLLASFACLVSGLMRLLQARVFAIPEQIPVAGHFGNRLS